MKRRQFLVTALAAGGLYALSYRAEAFIFGALLRFIIGGVTRRAAARAITSGVQVAARRAVRKASMKSVSALGLSSRLIAAVAPSVYAMAKEHDAKGIWVQDGYDNEFMADLENNSDAPAAGQLHYALQDVESERIEKEYYGGIIYAASRDRFRFPFVIADLPYTGLKRIVGRMDNPNVVCRPSSNIVVASADEVETR